MGFLDKLLGRGKQAAGDISMHEEHAQEAREDAAEHRVERET